MRGSNKLSALKISKIKTPGRYGDGQGLWLQVSDVGTKSWLFRYTRNGNARHMGLGSLHTISLMEARARALKVRQSLLDGIDPIAARNDARTNARIEATKSITFRECAEDYIKAHEAGWKNEKHRSQWQTTMATYAYPVIGNLPVSAVDTALVLRVIEPHWKTKPETAARVRGRIEQILSWATVRQFRSGENPAAWKNHLDQILPSRAKVQAIKHHAALPFGEMFEFCEALRQRQGNSARALEFTILTAARTGETIGAVWDEFDLDEKVWLVPATRMKAAKEHRVPLSDRAVDILTNLKNAGDGIGFVFQSPRTQRPLSNMAMLETLREIKGYGLTVHGFRSAFRDWAAEMTNYPNHVVEMALAHTVRDKVEAAYRRGDLLDRRRLLMRDWARFCEKRLAAPAVLVRPSAA